MEEIGMTREVNEKEVDRILAQRLKEQGTIVDGLQLIVFAKIAKSTASKKERLAALKALEEYEVNDPFE